MISSYKLLVQNRRRCCVCRNPAKPVEIHRIAPDKPEALENLALLCSDCYALALACKQEFGFAYLRGQLTQYKRDWEEECKRWRDGPDFTLRVRQGDIIKTIQKYEFYEFDGAVVDWYELDKGGRMHVDLRSDEFVTIDIRRQLSDAEQYGDISYFRESGYLFDFDFVATRSGWYALLVLNESGEKATVDLDVSTHLSLAKEQEDAIEELSTWVELQKLKQLELSSSDKGYVPWRILPPGEHPFPQIEKYFEELRNRKPHVRYQLERLHLISTLEPSKTIFGRDEFEGYVVFWFSGLDIAVLDCPVVGNAVYLLAGDWEQLSKLSKNELLKLHAKDVTRVVHIGDWFRRVQRSMRARKH